MFVVSALAGALAINGCKCGSQSPSPGPSASVSASASAVVSAVPAASAPAEPAARPVGQLPKAEALTIRTTDGVTLKASLWAGGGANAPAVILVHRLAGARSEWEPLVQRLFPPRQPMNVIAFDLRGHGESIDKGGEKRKLAWHTFKTDDFAKTAKDVAAVVDYMRKRSGGPPASLILVGSDLGATALVHAVSDAKLTPSGVCLISPGASLRGVDLYKPFATVMALPNLIVSSQGDNVSHDPVIALRSMSKAADVVILDGSAHSAEFLGTDKPRMWDVVADWIDRRAGGAASP